MPDPKVIISTEGQIKMMLEQITQGRYKMNRPVVAYFQIIPDGDTVVIAENLLNCQVFQVTGEDSSGNPIPGPLLQLNDVVGGTYLERLVLAQAVNVPEYLAPLAPKMVYTLITSKDLVVNLKPGHGIAKMWFAAIPPDYLVVNS